MSSSRLIDRIFGKWSSVPSPASFYLFSESELRDCQDYFSKVQSDPTVPPNELIMAAERLTLLRSEVDVRHGDANYRRAQRLAWSAIGLAMISLATAIGFGAAQILTKQPSRDNWPVDMETSIVSTAMATEVPTSKPEVTQSPNPTPDVTPPPVYAIAASTSTPTPSTKGRPRIKHRSPRQSVKKTDSNLRVKHFFRSLFQAKPT